MVYFAPCKINLGLDIISKREDGYHEIESVMIPVNGLCDIVEVLPMEDCGVDFSSSGIKIDCDDSDNLCVKAYYEFKKYFNHIGGVKIHLHKIVPFGAGLGGGSSDATSVIKALNDIFECKADISVLEKIAANIGSDTVFFVESEPKFCSGRGEILSPIDINSKLEDLQLTIIKPNINIGSREAYSGVTPHRSKNLIRDILSLPVTEWMFKLKNDFEPHIFKLYPELSSIKQQLIDLGAEYVSMSGSGSTIYALSSLNIDSKFIICDKKIFIHQEIL